MVAKRAVLDWKHIAAGVRRVGRTPGERFRWLADFAYRPLTSPAELTAAWEEAAAFVVEALEEDYLRKTAAKPPRRGGVPRPPVASDRLPSAKDLVPLYLLGALAPLSPPATQRLARRTLEELSAQG